MVKDEHGHQPGRHDPGHTVTERFRAWFTPSPVLSLTTCARCATTQVLSRHLEAEAEKVLRCGYCGADIATIATVERGARTTWINPFDTTARLFPASRYQATRTSPADRTS